MRTIKTLALIFLPCFMHTTLSAQKVLDSLDILVNKLGKSLLDEKQAIGLSIGIYANGASYFYNFGTSKAGTSVQPTQNTVYEIGSITKTFVSYVLAKAVLEGKVRLEDDVRKYLKGSYPNLEYNGHAIQLVHLANTTSLLPDWLPELPAAMKGLSPDSALQVKIAAYKKLNRQDFFKALHDVKLDTIPGTKRYHSNSGAQLLAYILEDVYHQSMQQLVEKYITRPQQMTMTSFLTSTTIKGLATGYTASDKQAKYELVMPYFRNAGGMVSCTADLLKYMQLMLNTTDKAAMLSLKKTAEVNLSTGNMLPLSNDTAVNPNVYSTALNWFKYEPAVKSMQVWADGGTNGFNSYIVLYPQYNMGIVLLANKSDEKIFWSLPGMASKISDVLVR